jgi:hypothetical protein
MRQRSISFEIRSVAPLNLATQRSGAPPLDTAHLRIEVAFERITDRQKHCEMGPSQLSQQCCDNWVVGELLHELHHSPQILFSEASTKLPFQLCPRRGHYSFAILRPLLLKDVLSNTLADTPVEQDQRGVHLPSHVLPSFGDQLP